jgi:hypothetical protein
MMLRRTAVKMITGPLTSLTTQIACAMNVESMLALRQLRKKSMDTHALGCVGEEDLAFYSACEEARNRHFIVLTNININSLTIRSHASS